MISLALTSDLKRQIEHLGVAAYPEECCGILFGRELDGKRVVEKLEVVNNAFDEQERYHRFLITPQTLLAAEKQAGTTGRLVLGFYHSHPDHPARPSEYDRSHAWPFYSYVIVAIRKGEPGEMTSWILDEQIENFVEQQIM